MEYKEAFCQMLYRCEKCGFLEILYNSRDGVTPFIIGCRQCNGAAHHIQWHLDNKVMGYKPPKGSRIFVNMDADKAREIATRRLDSFRGQGDFTPPSTISPEYTELFENLVNDIFADGTTPDIVKVEDLPVEPAASKKELEIHTKSHNEAKEVKMGSQKYVTEFVNEVYPDAPELAMASFSEKKCLQDATKLIRQLHIDKKALEDELILTKQWVDDLQKGMYVNCVYCGHRYGPADKVPVSMADVLKEHIEQCPKHPLSKMKAERDEWKKKFQALVI